MKKIGFVVDSTFGYTGNHDVEIVPLNVYINDTAYVDNNDFDPNIVVTALKNGDNITTSQPSPDAFLKSYQKQLDKGYDHVICMTIASSLSGTFNSANLAKDIIEDDRITVIDTKTGNLGATYILEEAIKVSNDKSLDEVINLIEDLIKKGSIIFSVDNLNTLVRGGRLSRISGFIGTLLKIKPILRFKEGVLKVESKVRGIMGVFKYIKNEVAKLIDQSKVIVRITFVDNKDYAISLAENISELGENVDVKITNQLTAAISAHIGLGGLGIYLIK